MVVLPFEYTSIDWGVLEDLQSAALFDVWGARQHWRDLPKTQQFRHRFAEPTLWMGCGTVSVPFQKSDHPNLVHKPEWQLLLACITLSVTNSKVAFHPIHLEA